MKINILEKDLSKFKTTVGSYYQIAHPLLWGMWRGDIDSAKTCFPLFACRDYWTEIILGLGYDRKMGATYKFNMKPSFKIETESTKIILKDTKGTLKGILEHKEAIENYLSNFHDADITIYHHEDLMLLEADKWWLWTHARIGVLTGILRAAYMSNDLKHISESTSGMNKVFIYNPKGSLSFFHPMKDIELVKLILDYGQDIEDPYDRIFATGIRPKEESTVRNKELYLKNDCRQLEGIHGTSNIQSLMSTFVRCGVYKPTQEKKAA